MTAPLTEKELQELDNDSYLVSSHYAHVDPEGRAGNACPACHAGIRAREKLRRLLAERRELREALQATRDRIKFDANSDGGLAARLDHLLASGDEKRT